MKTTRLALAAFAILVLTLLASGVAHADTVTYSYTSVEQLTLNNEPCDPCRVTLSITLANALAPSTSFRWDASGTSSGNQLDPILGMSFDNFGGLNDKIDPSSIQVATDKSGNIDEWAFTLNSAAFPLPSGTCMGHVFSSGNEDPTVLSEIAETISLTNCTAMFVDATDSVIFQPNTIFGSPTFWTEKTNVTTMNAPEPSTLMLLSIGVILACMRMRRRYLATVRALLFATVLWFVGPSATHAQNTWLGTSGTTGNWSDPTNWSSGTVPDGSTAITIPTGTVQDNFSFTNQLQIECM